MKDNKDISVNGAEIKTEKAQSKDLISNSSVESGAEHERVASNSAPCESNTDIDAKVEQITQPAERRKLKYISPIEIALRDDKPENRKLKLTVITVISVLFVGLLIFGVVYISMFFSYQKKVKSIVIGDVVISELSDGIYSGSHDVGFIYAEVKVTVKDGKIDNIVLVRHKNGRGENAEVIIYDVLREQSLEVDGIAGATNSSKTILKAIENALKSTPQPI